MTNNKSHPQIDFEMVRTKYPIAVERVRKWFLEKEEIREGFSRMGTDIVADDVGTYLAASVIQYDPRKLYDVFDSLGVRIFITDNGGTVSAEGEPVYYYYNSVSRISRSSLSRIGAEEDAFMDAFEIINQEDDKKEQLSSSHS